MSVDPSRLPAGAVEAAAYAVMGEGTPRPVRDEVVNFLSVRPCVAAFLTALMEDDAAMKRAYRAQQEWEGMDLVREALLAAVQEADGPCERCGGTGELSDDYTNGPGDPHDRPCPACTGKEADRG